jgi:hypothetical protein
MSDALLVPDDFVFTPAGDEIFRHLDVQWDIDGDAIPDVSVTLDSFMLYPYGAEFNGWQIRETWPWMADLDHDLDVDLADLAELLSNYGQRWGASFEDGDLNGDRDVDLSDLAGLLALYGTTYPGWVLWSDNFDSYPLGSGLHGQGGWEGWGNDPTLDALVTDAQAFSPPHSADIVGGADLVHEFSKANKGAWAFAAWQYIPAHYVSGSGEFEGSTLILLNDYAGGGPHEPSDRSVQLDFDSNDGMLKVYYGNGLNTVDVPYVPDQWVPIEIVVDLDTDWTQVYYNGGYVTEYSWTGGIYGGAGAPADIAALQLFANGSTSIYYDDLAVTRASGP